MGRRQRKSAGHLERSHRGGHCYCIFCRREISRHRQRGQDGEIVDCRGVPAGGGARGRGVPGSLPVVLPRLAGANIRTALLLLAAYAGNLKVWELASGKALAPILAEVDTSTVAGLAMLVGILNAGVSLQMTGTPGVGPPPPGRFNPDTRAAEGRYPAIFSPDGKHLAVLRFNPGLSGDHEIVLLDVKSRAIVATVPCQCFGLAFSPDGARIATAGHSAHGGPVQLWDPNTGNEIRPSH